MMFSGMAWNCKAAMFFAAYPVLNFTFTSRCQPDVSQTTSLGGSGNSTWIDGSLSFLAVRRAENSCFHLSFLRITILSLLLILSCIMIASQQLATSFPIWHLVNKVCFCCFNYHIITSTFPKNQTYIYHTWGHGVMSGARRSLLLLWKQSPLPGRRAWHLRLWSGPFVSHIGWIHLLIVIYSHYMIHYINN